MNSTFVVLITVLVIVLIVALCLWYLWPRTDESRVMGPFVLTGTPSEHDTVPMSPEGIFTEEQLNKSLKNNFTLSFFVFMDKINSERIPFAGPKGEYRFKPLLKIVGFGEFVLDPVHQSALLRTTPLVPLVMDGKLNSPPYVEVDNILNSRWNQIVIGVEGRSIDIYVNGHHATSLLLENLTWSMPTAVLLDTSPDFWGQAGFFQVWPRRLTESEILTNYRRVTDQRGKPLIPERINYKNIRDQMSRLLCRVGICPDPSKFREGGLDYIDYEYA